MTRAAGDPYLVIKRSHRWFWLPRVGGLYWKSHTYVVNVHWFRLFIGVYKSPKPW